MKFFLTSQKKEERYLRNKVNKENKYIKMQKIHCDESKKNDMKKCLNNKKKLFHVEWNERKLERKKN